MSMSVGGSDNEDEIIATINTTPLVDVMLVLLIIFLITIPVVTHTVPVSLPKVADQPQQTKPENINLSVTADGTVYWDQTPMTSNDMLVERLKVVAVKEPQPEVEIRGDANVRYESVGRVVFDAERAGIQKVGFLTEPPPRG